MVDGTIRGFASFFTVATLSALCIMWGVSPDQLIADFFTAPPDFLVHPLTRLAALVVGALLGWWTWGLFQTWRRSMATPTHQKTVFGMTLPVLGMVISAIAFIGFLIWQLNSTPSQPQDDDIQQEKSEAAGEDKPAALSGEPEEERMSCKLPSPSYGEDAGRALHRKQCLEEHFKLVRRMETSFHGSLKNFKRLGVSEDDSIKYDAADAYDDVLGYWEQISQFVKENPEYSDFDVDEFALPLRYIRQPVSEADASLKSGHRQQVYRNTVERGDRLIKTVAQLREHIYQNLQQVRNDLDELGGR